MLRQDWNCQCRSDASMSVQLLGVLAFSIRGRGIDARHLRGGRDEPSLESTTLFASRSNAPQDEPAVREALFLHVPKARRADMQSHAARHVAWGFQKGADGIWNLPGKSKGD